ncbi:MAG: acyltransferase [Acidimicrobiia bacterium]|nr:acyltransferase [Acidimicrobiia bacterium]
MNLHRTSPPARSLFAGDEPDEERTSPSAPRLPHVEALDGLRGACVLAVLCFHAGFSWASGGFLGVSTFFTLSGFLITTLLLVEHRHSSRVDVVSFWRRRARRLLPAASLGILLAIAYALFAGTETQRQGIFGDTVASVGYVANWWFMAGERAYGDDLMGQSPLLHYWSLAIEEQFYLFFPVVALLVLARVRGRTRLAVAVVGVAAACSLSPLVLDLSPDVTYYATPTRMGELLVGVALALFFDRRASRGGLVGRNRVPQHLAAAGLVAAAATVVLWVVTTTASGWVYQGGLGAYAILSAAVIAAALVPGNPLAAVLGLPVLRWLGTISYGVYVYHWPIFLWLDEQRTGLSSWPLFVVRMAVTLALAEASYRLVERRIRYARGTRSGPRAIPLVPAAVAAAVVLSATALVVSVTAPDRSLDLDATQRDLSSALAQTTSSSPGVATEAADGSVVLPPGPRPRIAVYGDSTALSTASGLARWAELDGEVDVVLGSTRLGCGLGRATEHIARTGLPSTFPPHCSAWHETWPEAVRAAAPNLAVVQTGPWDVVDRQLSAGGPFVGPGDPTFDAWVRDEFLDVVDVLSADGALVVWLTSPPDSPLVAARAGPGDGGALEPERWDHLNGVIEQLPALRPGRVEVVDLAAWIDQAGDRDFELRPDGVHFSEATALEVAREFLGPELLALYDTATADDELALRWAPPPTPLRPLASDEPTRVLVWTDPSTRPVVSALEDVLGDDVAVFSFADSSCGVIGSLGTSVDGVARAADPMCLRRTDLEWSLDRIQPHLVLLLLGGWELGEQRLPGVSTLVAPGDWPYSDWARADLARGVDMARANGAAVAIAAVPAALGGGRPGGDRRAASLVGLVEQVAHAPSRAAWATAIDAVSRPVGVTDTEIESWIDADGWTPDGAAEVARLIADDVLPWWRRLAAAET